LPSESPRPVTLARAEAGTERGYGQQVRRSDCTSIPNFAN
jgi:hypothetical protein